MESDVSVDASNLTQLANWDGATGGFWAEHADRFDDGVAGYRTRFLAAAAISDGSRVLDVGCGSGQTTRDAARAASDGTALGIDLSTEMLALARHRAQREHVENADFQHADAQVHPFGAGQFDVVISRHGAMFFGDPLQAFSNLARALRPGGRLVLLTWQPFERQEWLRNFLTILSPGRPVQPPPAEGPGPFALSGPDRVRALLGSAGFDHIAIDALQAPMYYGADPDDALRFVAGQQAAMIGKLREDEQRSALAQLRTDLAGHLGNDGVHYDSAAWLVHATRRR